MRIEIAKGGPLLAGVNYRLSYGWDFGVSPGPRLNVGEPDRAQMMDDDCALLAAAGVRVLRWFVFCDGRNGIVFSGETPAGLDEVVASSVRTALAMAEKHGLHILFVLLDHTLCFAAEAIGDGTMVKQGHGRLLKQPDLFEALASNVFLPFWRLVNDHPNVIGYELINEPEMAMKRRDGWRWTESGCACPLVPEMLRLTFEQMADRMIRTRSLLHEFTTAQFSIGSMKAKWLGRWTGCIDADRDFLTFHYYGDEPDFDMLLERRIAPLLGGYAVGLGEFYPNAGAVTPAGHGPWPEISTSRFLEASQSGGLQMALAWVWRPGPNDPGEIPVEEFRAFQARLEHNREYVRPTSVLRS